MQIDANGNTVDALSSFLTNHPGFGWVVFAALVWLVIVVGIAVYEAIVPRP